MSQTTMMGRTKQEWRDHIDKLFEIAHEGEDIPEAALIFAWPGKPTAQDIANAVSQWDEEHGKLSASEEGP